MRQVSTDHALIGVMAAAAILAAVLLPPMAGYPAIILVGVFAGVPRLTRAWPDRAFCLACAGTLLVAASAAASTWEGLGMAWLVAGIIATVMEFPMRSIPALLAAFLATAAITLMIEMANHVLLPLVILACMTGLIAAVMAIRDYRFRKHYSGVPV